jgi:hypothetical protein
MYLLIYRVDDKPYICEVDEATAGRYLSEWNEGSNKMTRINKPCPLMEWPTYTFYLVEIHKPRICEELYTRYTLK